jgi:voltage-gated potassium channel
VATLTTIGYGDVYPVTVAGRICASIISVLGIGLFALPSGILVAGFIEEINAQKSKPIYPHCGKEIV